MRNLLSFLSALTVLVQIVVINYYSFYGVYKSFSEHFCIYGRPNDYSTGYRVGPFTMLNMPVERTDANLSLYKNLDFLNIIAYDQKFSFARIASNGESGLQEPVKPYPGDHDGMYHFRDHNNVSYSLSVSLNELLITSYSNDVYTELKCDTFQPFINDYEASYYDNKLTSGPNGLNKTGLWNIHCSLINRDKICTVPYEKTLTAFKIFYIILSAVVLLFFTTLFKFKDHFTLRCYTAIKTLFGKNDWGKFCNPVTGKSVKYYSGENYYTLELNNSYNYKTFNLNSFEDLNGRYTVFDGKVSIVTGGKVEILNLDQNSELKVKHYLSLINFNYKNCVVLNRKHFLKTDEVIKKLVSGSDLVLNESVVDFVVNEVEYFFFDYLVKNFNIKSNTVDFLLEHNRLFFKGIRKDALLNCLRGKASHRFIPDGIKNSQWKFYGSDFRQIMLEMQGVPYFSQVKWNPSQPLLSLREYVKTNRLPRPKDLEIETSYLKVSEGKVEFNYIDRNEYFIRNFNYNLGETSEQLSKSVKSSIPEDDKPLAMVEINDKILSEIAVVEKMNSDINSMISKQDFKEDFYQKLEGSIEKIKEIDDGFIDYLEDLSNFRDTTTHEEGSLKKKLYSDTLKSYQRVEKPSKSIRRDLQDSLGRYGPELLKTKKFQHCKEILKVSTPEDIEYMKENEVILKKKPIKGPPYDRFCQIETISKINDNITKFQKFNFKCYNFYDKLLSCQAENLIEASLPLKEVITSTLRRGKKRNVKQPKKGKSKKKVILRPGNNKDLKNCFVGCNFNEQLKAACLMLKRGYRKVSSIENHLINKELLKPHAVHHLLHVIEGYVNKAKQAPINHDKSIAIKYNMKQADRYFKATIKLKDRLHGALF